MIKKTTHIYILMALFLSSHVFATDIYVAKNGDDANAGTIESPYKTISKAASIAVAGNTVFIREGTYEETLTPANSGVAGMPIIFQSYPGEKVIISAMEALSGWVNDSGSIYKTTIPFSSLGQLNFVMNNETALDLARWPNKTEADPFALGTKRNTGGSDGTVINGAYLTESSIPSIDWTGGALWFYGDRPGSGWLAWKRIITSSTAGRVNFNFTGGTEWIRTFHPPADKGDFFLEGVKGALDYQNEWYYNTATNELFVQLPGGSAPTDGAVKMRRRTATINIVNKKYIEIRNIAVFGGSINLDDDTRWTTNTNTTNNVLYGVSSFYGAHTQGAVDSFSTGLASVKIEGSNNKLEKCEIAFGAAAGINVKGNNHLIQNNFIHDFNYLGSYDAPVVIRGIKNTLVKNNTVRNGGRDAIQYYGNDNEIAYNDVSRSNLIADDCALFYTVGLQPNTEIHHNWFHDAASSGTKKKAAGIYLDNDAEGFSVHHNVVWNTEWTSIQINWNGKDIDIFNNTLWNGEAVMGAWHQTGTAFSNVMVWNNLGSDANWEPQSDKQNNLVVTASVFDNVGTGDFNLKTGASPIDQGKEIAGITDGFIGSKPDVGAYEHGGVNWVAGIDWEPLYGPAELGCYGLPGENCLPFLANDDDRDGVVNDNDLCADTPLGTSVNVSGCPVFTIAADNFTISGRGETCAVSDNGSIAIISKETTLAFTAKIEESGVEKSFTASTVFDNLIAGEYTVCITTAADANYKQCFYVTITQPANLAVSSKVNNTKNQVDLSLEGGQLYTVSINDVVTVTNENHITLDLVSGKNSISVKTDKDCQGHYEETINLFGSVLVYPNYVTDVVTVAFEDDLEQVTYQVISATGKVLIQNSDKTTNRELKLNLEPLSSGMYFISINAQNINFQSKLIKK
jgi:hypothetical protein